MVCANPDIVAVLPDGGFGMAPGAVAHHYEQLGGRVRCVGKPHRPIYPVCLEALGDMPRSDVLTIGDSIAQDVAGGAAMELDTALIMSGIHGPMFDPERRASANRAALEQLKLRVHVPCQSAIYRLAFVTPSARALGFLLR
jgi:ribonucleotide monophosphatase NagD (HAD superfamily)